MRRDGNMNRTIFAGIFLKRPGISSERTGKNKMPDKKKITILYSTAGMGHKKAAIALYDAFRKKTDDVDIEIIDVLDYANRLYRFLYLDFYVFMMSRAKWLWGILYYFSNNLIVEKITQKARWALDHKCLPGLAEKIAKKDPDAVIATHFLLPSIAPFLREQEGFRAKMYTLITDYGPHAYWLSEFIDRFFVGAEPVVEELVKKGIEPDKITVTGIPTTGEFIRDHDLHALREKYGLDPGRKTVFMMSGGFGVGPIGEMLLSLNSCACEIQVITVCGHNKATYHSIRQLKERLDYPLVLFGFTDKVAELMAVSELMVTKAGGISVTEALNMRLPMILFGSIPGQETWNEKLLVSSGAAEKVVKVEEIPPVVDRILLSEDVYVSMAEGIDRIRRPDAAEAILETVMQEI
ncbi:MAG: hypothetical protein GF409_03850 [Candidatus Omnitrophica bacterium]|nr:hypothetical protein [Candidatus Omnitrophota bacterium]